MDAKIEKLQQVFKTMTYGENLEDTSGAKKWLQTIEITDKSGDIDGLLEKLNTIKYVPEKCHLIRLAQELEKSVDIICQIEILSRGVLSQDTKGAIDKLAQYFYYYAALCDGKCNTIAAGIFEDDHPLWILGLFMAPALAAGCKIVLQTGTKYAAVITFILELAAKVGIPKEALIVIPTNEGGLQPYLNNKDVSTISLFVDVSNEKYDKVMNPYNKKLLIFAGYKTPMLVFDNADLDSAVENAVYAAWIYQGMLPWSMNTILVQENIYKRFTEKLKNKLDSVKIGSGDDKLADISYPSNRDVIQRMARAVEKARQQGIEVYQKATSSPTNFTPTLIMGFKVDTNIGLSNSMVDTDGTVTILPFRSVDEAIHLANNNRQGLAASIWSENIGLVNEVSRKLKVANVWINGYGHFSPILPLCPIKNSGMGYFGGKQGKLEYDVGKDVYSTALSAPSSWRFENVEAFNKSILSSKKALINSSKRNTLDKMKQFTQLDEFLESNGRKLCAKLEEKWLNDFKDGLNSVMFKSQEMGNDTLINGYRVMSEKSPRGIIVIEMRDPYETHNIKLLLAALFEGNAIILLNESSETQEFYQQLSKQLPTGILTVLPYNLNAVQTALYNKELNGYFSSKGNCVSSFPQLRDSKIVSLVENNFEWEHIFNQVRVYKNVWSNIGQSSQCNFE